MANPPDEAIDKVLALFDEKDHQWMKEYLSGIGKSTDYVVTATKLIGMVVTVSSTAAINLAVAIAYVRGLKAGEAHATERMSSYKPDSEEFSDEDI